MLKNLYSFRENKSLLNIDADDIHSTTDFFGSLHL